MKIHLGAYVSLNSGGPVCVVVDLDGDEATIAWKNNGEVNEVTLPSVYLFLVDSLDLMASAKS